MDTSEFTVENLSPLVGTAWRAESPDGQSVDLQLTDVVKTLDKHADSRFKRDSFALYFRGPSEPFLQQATYAFQHETIGGPHYIFIVPSSKDANGFRYEAVFT